MVLLSLAISPKTSDDAQRLTTALEQLSRDDSALHVRAGQLPGEMVIGGTSEEHLEVVVDRLKREFRVEASLGRPEVTYKEALTRPAEGEMKYARQTRGRGSTRTSSSTCNPPNRALATYSRARLPDA